MMEKVVRMQREAEEIEKKKIHCEKIRNEKLRSTAVIALKKQQKKELSKLRSLN